MTASIQMEKLVFWVGAIDWSVRNFHGYRTEEGTSYNSYLLMDEQPTIIDSVKARFAAEQVERIAKLVALEKVQNVIVNHAEGDHTGALPHLMKNLPNAKIITNKVCQAHLLTLYPSLSDCQFQIIDSTSVLDTGTRKLQFIMAPGVHWPDSMFTFDRANGILFSNDGFGQHVACSERFADQIVDLEHLVHLMREYMANILAPCKAQLKNVLEAAATLDIKTILTAHGCSWRGNLLSVPISEYVGFVSGSLCSGVLVVFDSFTSQTEFAARCLAEGALKHGKYRICDLRTAGLTEIALHASVSAAFAFGCPTVNGRLTAKMEACLRYLKGLKLLQDKPYCTFGSFGWASKACQQIQSLMREERCLGSVDFKIRMNGDDKEKIFALGELLAKACAQTGAK